MAVKQEMGDEHLWWLLAMKQDPPGDVEDEPLEENQILRKKICLFVGGNTQSNSFPVQPLIWLEMGKMISNI